MSEARRNMAVGLFVVVGLVILGAMILQFNSLASLTGKGYNVTVKLDHSGNIMSGKLVHFNGVVVGTVKSVAVAEGGQGVIVVLRINEGVSIPENAQMRAQSTTMGDTVLDFVLPRDEDGNWLKPGKPLPTNGQAVITGSLAKGSPLLPQDLTNQATAALAKFEQLDIKQISKALGNLAEMTEPRSVADVDAGKVQPNLATAIARIDAAAAKLADEENNRNFKEVLKNAASATSNFSDVAKQAKDLMGQWSVATARLTADADALKEKSDKFLTKLLDDAVRLGDLLGTFNSLAKGVQEGEGTVGKLLKSEDLHKQLVLLTADLQEAAKTLNRLLVKLEKEGLMRKGD